jgi:hypothetical protein
MAESQDTALSRAATGSALCQYSLDHKLRVWIMLRRLELQPKFDSKLHKNKQLWDDIVQEFFSKFPWQTHRTKTSIRDQWDKHQHMFRNYCKTAAAYAEGHSLGLGSDDQERVLSNKSWPCHNIFYRVQARPAPYVYASYLVQLWKRRCPGRGYHDGHQW